MSGVEPMDLDGIESDFDNKENTFHINNAFPKGSSIEKGHENLDMSEVNMKLRCSNTHGSPSMSKSFTTNYIEAKNISQVEDNNIENSNSKLTRSLNSTLDNCDVLLKTPKPLPLQSIITGQCTDLDRNVTAQGSFHTSEHNIKVNIDPDDVESLSSPSAYSSLGHTPEATTPTKEIPKDGGSPIMRGLKSVLSMFRSSQSPIPPVHHSDDEKQDNLETVLQTEDSKPHTDTVPLASTPMKNKKINGTSPLKDSVAFKDDLERELLWKEDSAVFFKDEKVPLHILFPTNTSSNVKPAISSTVRGDQNISVEYMDISLNETITSNNVNRIVQNVSNTDLNNLESDCEFQDCETTINNYDTENIEGKQSISKDFNQDHNINMSGVECMNKEVLSKETESQQCALEQCLTECGISLNTEFMKENHVQVTNSNVGNIIKINSHLSPDVVKVNSSMDAISGTNFQNTEIAIKLNDTIDIKTCSDHELENVADIVPGTEIVHNINTEPNVESVPENGDVHNEPVKFNNTIDIDTHLGTEDSLVNETSDGLHKSCSVDRTLEQEQMSFEIEKSNSNRTVHFETSLDTEDNVYSERKQKAVEISTIVTENLNDTHNICNSSNEDILGINVVKTSGDFDVNRNLTITTELNNDNVQGNLVELSVKPKNGSEPQTNFPSNTKESGTKLAEDLNFIATNDEVSEQIHQNAVLPDVVQSNDKPEVVINEDEVMKSNHDVEIIHKNDIICMNVDILENQNPLHDNGTEKKMIDRSQNNVNEEKGAINNIDFQKADILRFEVEAASTAIKNTSADSQDVKDVTENKTEKSSITSVESVEEKNCLSVDENVNGLSAQTQISLHLNAISISEPFTKDITSEHNIVDESGCSTDFLTENQKFAFDSSTSVMNDNRRQDESSVHIGNMEIEETREEHLSSSNKNCDSQDGKEDVKSTIDSDEKLIAGDSKNLEENVLYKNVYTITSIKTDSDIGLSFMKPSDTISNIQNEDIVSNFGESQQIHCEPSEIDLDDLEVENINKSQTQDNATLQQQLENHLKTKSKLNTPPSSPKIESKGYNFNFDEIDDPFATKTKMRSSPPLTNAVNNICAPIEAINKPNNRKQVLLSKRRSQPLPKKQNVCKKKMNATFNETVLDVKENNINLNETQPIENHQNTDNVFNQNEIQNDANENNINVQQETDSQKDDNVIKDKTRELNISYDANTRNVFNLPEIEDRNFNPFTTRTKVCLTPPIVNNNHVVDNEPLDTNRNNTTVMITKEDSEEFHNSNYIELSRHEDETLKEVNTEDEDTIEGPFLELEDLVQTEKGETLDEKHDYMTFDDLPKQQTDEAENEMFIDAEAFEFLLNQNQANVVADSGKESLFLKFDPLFAKRVSSDGILAALSNFQKKQSTPKKEKRPEQSFIRADTSDAFPSCSKNVPAFDNVDESSLNNISKPTMVVNPAVVSPRKAATPPKINRQSLTFTSPAMAVIDKLLSLSGNTNTSFVSNHDTSLAQSCSEQHHTDVALTQLREMLAEKEMHVQVLRNERKELTSRLGALESQVKTLEHESEDRLRKINDLHSELTEKNKQNKNMATVVEEYERTIATLVSELEQDRKSHAEERMRLIRDRDEQTAHLASMEISFNDLHSKYEKSKQIILSLKANEDCLKKSLQEFTDSQVKIQNNYELLKQHATAKLNHANQELEKLNKAHEAEVLKLKAMMKRKDLHISSLEETLAQKTKANEELTAICDELINKVG